MSAIRLLIRPAIFTAGVCGTCFCGAVVVNYENTRRLYPIKDWIAYHRFESSLSHKYLTFRQRINRWKNQLTIGEKIAAGTIAINFLVLCSWRLNKLQPVMMKYFISQTSDTKIALSPMILSCFSHFSPLHFACNMFALYAFSNQATIQLGPEKLVGLFLSAGAVSSFTSIANRLLTKRPVPSLGASGAILGVVAYICVSMPQLQVFLLFFPVAAGTAIKTMMMIDFVGLVAKWKIIDHAAHLGGSSFGIWYAFYGDKLYNEHRGTVIKKWLEIKERFQE